MCRHLFILFVLLFVATSPAQQIDSDSTDLSHLMKKAPTHWWDISYGCSTIAPDYFNRQDQDSLMLILKYWEEHTRYYEPIRRLWMLTQIYNDDFDPAFISNAVIEDFYAYQERVEEKSDSSDWYLWSGDKSTAMISQKFNSFTQNLADSLLQFDDLSDDERLIAIFYSNNFTDFWQEFQNGDAANSILYRRFYRHFKEMTQWNLHYDFFGGWYSPRKSLAQLGGKIKIGAGIGLDVQRVTFDAALAFRGLNSDRPYRVGYKGDMFETTDYLGIYLGLEPAFHLYDFGRLKINLLGGAALDIIEAIPSEKNPYQEESVDLFAGNFNLGLGGKFYVIRNQPWYLRCQVRYEFAGYNTHGGTDLSDGEAVTFRLGFGWDENAMKYKLQKYFATTPR